MASLVENQTNKPQQKAKKSSQKEIQELGMFKSEDDMINFFEDERYRKYHYLTYKEYLEIYGKTIDTNFLPKINKKLIYGHFEYFNYCYDQTWKYKWYPIFGMFALNLVRFKSPSVIGTLAYLYTFDYFFENFFLHRNNQIRFIDVRNSFSYHLNKKKYINLRQKYLEKYVQIVNRNIQQGEYKQFKVSKITDKIIIGKDKSRKLDEDLEIQQEYESYNTITNEDLKKKEEEKLLQIIQKNKFYQFCLKVQNYANLFIQNAKGGINFNQALDDFFKVGIYNLANKFSKNFAQFQKEFGQYKQDIGTFPTRGDYFQMLYYKELNQNKVYNLKDQLRERINQSIDLYNYVFKNKLTKSFVNINWIHPEHIDVNPTYKINSYLMDFITFTVICCVPFKIFNFRQKTNQIMLLLRQQKAKFNNQ
ncbi:hypothetical protein TTHERM_00393230 (macronuclear) [Tetrahymena thermophila SB210]|uniref:Uncharacterized protein n=1 Tax=Tetrahymena thermophila (strain SB210) TaxID=312017 RepID=Q233D1_TETTS|nr:hypothetical protein TTHERM_00393230 [Tetrahymena thermophila SB210]EAR91649.4 hypothetical protein TTHERM_00393230 [Tetrahymena thermophila SB210]|eukprot:XP_001011894.4 hypothetical protein TTHERM_00393230 [Tetrahymena thermophila SB210]